MLPFESQVSKNGTKNWGQKTIENEINVTVVAVLQSSSPPLVGITWLSEYNLAINSKWKQKVQTLKSGKNLKGKPT